MKEKLTKNLNLKILSLLLAVVLWVVILNVDDPVMTVTIRNIEVVKTNATVLESKDKIYEVVSGNTVDIKVKGKRSVVESLKATDFQAVADLSQLSIVNAVPIDVTPVARIRDSVEIINQATKTLIVSLENLAEKDFRVDVVDRGTVPEGYYLSEKKTSPNMIQVSGAETVINKISEIVVEIDASNIYGSDNTITAIPKVYDKNGSLMDTSNLTLNYTEVDVTTKLLPTKTVLLNIEFTGTPPEGYEYVKLKYQPESIMIAGEQGVLDQITEITGTYEVNNEREDIEDQIDIMDLITEDVILIDENQYAVINVDVEQLVSKEILLDTKQIDVRNLLPGYEVLFTADSIRITVYGKEEDINGLTEQDLFPYLDLQEEEEGTKMVNLQFGLTNVDFSVKNKSVSIIIQEIG